MEHFENMCNGEKFQRDGMLYETMGKMKRTSSPREYKKLKEQGWKVVREQAFSRGRKMWIMREPSVPVIIPLPKPQKALKKHITPKIPVNHKVLMLRNQINNLKKKSMADKQLILNQQTKVNNLITEKQNLMILLNEQKAIINEMQNQIEILKKELEKHTKKTGIESCTYSPDTPYKAYGINPVNGRKQWFRDINECKLFYSQY